MSECRHKMCFTFSVLFSTLLFSIPCFPFITLFKKDPVTSRSLPCSPLLSPSGTALGYSAILQLLKHFLHIPAKLLVSPAMLSVAILCITLQCTHKYTTKPYNSDFSYKSTLLVCLKSWMSGLQGANTNRAYNREALVKPYTLHY